jgi:uncharacterized protein (TIGR02266 family)
MSLKDGLKGIITERLRGVASSIFIERVLTVLDESADTKESFLSAADSISKRIALFIDTALAKEIFDFLRIEIENGALTPGARRKHVRVNFCTRVHVTHNGATSELFTANLSVGGMCLKTTEPFAVGAKVELSLPLEGGNHINLKGVVVNARSSTGKHQPGMGIEFNDVGDYQRKLISNLVKKAAAQDLIKIRS